MPFRTASLLQLRNYPRAAQEKLTAAPWPTGGNSNKPLKTYIKGEIIMNLRDNLTRFITTEFLDGAEHEAIPDDLNLLESGIIDSLGILRLVVYLEEELNVVIEPEQMLPKNLSSIGAIMNLVNAESGVG
ncbi:MAG: hypothetical protein CTY34_04075 [Methylobacter sp.]|nr:MAG: hypothetical protein CTY34_04075 [Methylobacter sp.]PPD19460.1 MAG: hypothetical protein CTY24_10795 [Methylobacter sp.]PPD35464.1 MAG: hypothetical protein CTY18_06205 [Methylomonas sp.]